MLEMIYNQQMEEAACFYNEDEEFGEFSNFYAGSFKVGETVYQTNEHYFQSHKFEDLEYCKKIATAATPLEAMDLGRSREHPLRGNWNEVKEQVMYDGLKHKFTQNEHCKKVLLQTGKRPIIQHTCKDGYWGDGGDGSGKNRLGHILMALREELSH